MIDILKDFKQIILYGPPGTGKTHLAEEIAEELTNKKDDNHGLVQFHPSYNYEDFVRGITVETADNAVRYVTKDKKFVEFCKKAQQAEDDKFVLIIDEINRADIASVFGELIYALEYRGNKKKPVSLPYPIEGDDKLTVPNNLYLIGTMNTADRSIGRLDYAIRRRFCFYQMLPDENFIKHERAIELFRAVATLFGRDVYKKEKDADYKILSPDYRWQDVLPGHTYFISKKHSNGAQKDAKKDAQEEVDDIAKQFTYQVWPLLMEYYQDGVLIEHPKSKLEDVIKEDIFNDEDVDLEKVKRFLKSGH